jgi:hypothetical protein
LTLTKKEKALVPLLPNGWDLNLYAKWAPETLPKDWEEKWHLRTSCMPFSMHGIMRLNWLRPFPTIHSSAGRWIHPDHDRPMTVGELATVMGWGGLIPKGPNPVGQIAKGVTPAAGEWLAEQARAYLDDEWGSEDWESKYCNDDCVWKGGNAEGALEKTFNLTRYTGTAYDEKDYTHVPTQQHRFPVFQRRATLKQRQLAALHEQIRKDKGSSGIQRDA